MYMAPSGPGVTATVPPRSLQGCPLVAHTPIMMGTIFILQMMMTERWSGGKVGGGGKGVGVSGRVLLRPGWEGVWGDGGVPVLEQRDTVIVEDHHLPVGMGGDPLLGSGWWGGTSPVGGMHFQPIAIH